MPTQQMKDDYDPDSDYKNLKNKSLSLNFLHNEFGYSSEKT